MVAKQSTHVRLPGRSEAVGAREQIPGQPPSGPTVIDPRTVSQEPVVKPKGMTP